MIEIFLKKKFFYPNEYQKTVFDIDFNKLKSKGIQHILIDLDNTLIPYDEHLPNTRIEELVNQVKSLGLTMTIISNNKEKRVQAFSKAIQLDYVNSSKKPLKYGFKKALKKLSYPSVSTVCLIGDQFMTDVFGGNRMGFYTIVVDAIKRKTEKWYTKLNRKLENKVLLRLKKTDPDFYDLMNLAEKR
ncbi:MAG: YqeG family HAD IIIA-type phosphatase [Candidatus Izemoplasmatales bacterium]|uniref:YqeG family HAD IIIA-type phosphatase n=1 Tax=Hujiaoplasma nucleasis TaxID=2725268 RepID=A0A7L6N1K8_9MOLU|nr:YqeG family HAD IIIA-type phosphatase [Hujiaoplasma nucleasis]QLY39461.1 YqeG family HAD IIIA-type phosphatase [Hujiaoplasma nucleasis]